MTILIISRNKESADPLVDALRRYDKIKIVHLSYSDLNPQLISELGGIDIVINRQNSETKDPSHFFNSKYCRFTSTEIDKIDQWINENINIGSKTRNQSGKKSLKPVAVEELSEDEDIPLANTLTASEKIIGDYELTKYLKSDKETETHIAIQRSINREVSLTLLKQNLTHSENSVNNFRECVRAKASVSHPNIVAVYEGHENEGRIFYTSELLSGQSLENTLSYGLKINQSQILDLLKVIIETQLYLKVNQIPHTPLELSEIFINPDGTIRVANTAIKKGAEISNEQNSIRYLTSNISSLVDINTNLELFSLLNDFHASDRSYTWERFSEAIQHYQKIHSDTVDSTLDVQRSGHRLLFCSSVICALIGIFLVVYFSKNQNSPPGINNTNIDEMIRIDGGEFIYQSDETKTLPTFWIDKYETTISQYKAFLDALENQKNAVFDHPDQPKDKTDHKPKYWDQYYNAAIQGKKFMGHLITPNSPVIFVDWWDAFAYAKWKGRRLPTEEEWEKSGRGKVGNIYPWGNNSNSNFVEKTGDNASKWQPVSLIDSDVSSAGVAGLLGNVTEWTMSIQQDPEIIGKYLPVLRGGNTESNSKKITKLTDRKALKNRNFRSSVIGFRTLSETDPSLKNIPLK